MAQFNFDQASAYGPVYEKNSVDYFQLKDHGWFAQVRFMYDAGETFQAFSVHEIKTPDNKTHKIQCLREAGQPLNVCPLCHAGNPALVKMYVPLYVISITKVINGIPQPEEVVNKVMLFERGKSFCSVAASVVRQCQQTPIVSNVFNLVRDGKAQDTNTKYMAEFLKRDNTTLADLPYERFDVTKNGFLKSLTAEEMQQYTVQSSVTPRTMAVNNKGNFGGASVPF